MSDGAHMGVSAGRALETVLGDAPQPEESERRSPEEMRIWLLAAPAAADFDRENYGDEGYEECARIVGGECLRWAIANPERYAVTPMEDDYDWEGDPDHGSQGQKAEFLKARSLYGILKDEGVDLARLGITGFQWGWAWNACAYAMGRGPSQNPAIMEVGAK